MGVEVHALLDNFWTLLLVQKTGAVKQQGTEGVPVWLGSEIFPVVVLVPWSVCTIFGREHLQQRVAPFLHVPFHLCWVRTVL